MRNERDLTERLAKAMGWERHTPLGEGNAYYAGEGAPPYDMGFRPYKSRDSFALVLDEVARRGLGDKWIEQMARAHERLVDAGELGICDGVGSYMFWLVTAPLPVACECALKALEGSHE